MPRLLRSRDLVRVPWKNGGGTTAEIAVHPADAGFETFDWRISMADVERDGPFSRFPGIDRTLVLVEGRGLVLAVDGRPRHFAGPGDLLSFDGEVDTAARLAEGPVRDLNVMSRRGRFVHRVTRVTGDEAPLAWSGQAMLAVAALEPLQVRIDALTFALARRDLLLIEERFDAGSLKGDAVVIAIAAVQDGGSLRRRTGPDEAAGTPG